MIVMERKVLFNVLKSIGIGREFDVAPDREYLKALEKIGLIKMDWDNTLTDFGKETLESLRDSIEKW
jgi:hypothetical protein